MLVEALTYRFRGHSAADPEEYRTKEEVEEWRRRDPIVTFGDAARGRERDHRGRARARWTPRRSRRADAAVEFADASPVPAPDSLYDDVYVLGGAGAAAGTRSDERRRGAGRWPRRAATGPERRSDALMATRDAR